MSVHRHPVWLYDYISFLNSFFTEIIVSSFAMVYLSACGNTCRIFFKRWTLRLSRPCSSSNLPGSINSTKSASSMSFLLTVFWRRHKPVLPSPPTIQLDKQCNFVCLRPRCEQFNQRKIRQKIRVKFLTFLELPANEKQGCIFYRKVATGMGTKPQSCVPSQTKWLSFKASDFWCTAKLKALLLFQQTNSKESVQHRVSFFVVVSFCFVFQND